MSLEDLTGTKYIDDLNSSNPVGATDPKSEGDDHIRGIKNVLKTSFPGITGAVTSTHTELNLLDGVTSTTAELNILDGVTSTAAELNILDGATATATEINALDADQAATTPTVAGDDSFVMDDADVGTVKVDIDNVDTYLAATTKTLTNKSIDGSNNTLTNVASGSLKTTTVSLSGTIATLTFVDITLSAYSFFPMIHIGQGGTSKGVLSGHGTDGAGADNARLGLYNIDSSSDATYDIDYRYIQS